MTAGRSEKKKKKKKKEWLIIRSKERALEAENILPECYNMNANQKPVKQRRGEKRGEVE